MPWDILQVVLILLLCANLLQLTRHRSLFPLPGKKPQILEEKIMAMVEEGEEQGSIQSSEKELIENIFEFNDHTAEDMMIHRRDVVMIAKTDTQATILALTEKTGLSRFPVYDQSPDDVIGTLSIRQYLLNILAGNPKPLDQLLRPAYFVPETVPATQLLRDMQWKKTHIALVVDEYGGVSGLITLEDLLEEIVGNIYDEFDPQAQLDIIQLEENLWRVAGNADLEEVAHAVGFPLPEDLDFDTVGGLVFDQLDMIPHDDSCPTVEALGLRITVETMVERRIQWVTLCRLPQPSAP